MKNKTVKQHIQHYFNRMEDNILPKVKHHMIMIGKAWDFQICHISTVMQVFDSLITFPHLYSCGILWLYIPKTNLYTLNSSLNIFHLPVAIEIIL